MNPSAPDDVPPPMLRTLQIVVGALTTGIVSFSLIAAILRSRNQQPGVDGAPVLSYVALGAGVVILCARAIVIPIVAKAGRKLLLNDPAVSTTKLMAQFTTRTIVGAAILEGAGFLFLTAYLTEGQPWALAGGLMMAGLLAVLQFPTRPRVEAAIEAERRAIEDERAMGTQ